MFCCILNEEYLEYFDNFSSYQITSSKELAAPHYNLISNKISFRVYINWCETKEAQGIMSR